MRTWTKKAGLGLLAAALLATLAEAPAADREKGGKKGGDAPAARPENKNNNSNPPPPRESRPPRVEAPRPPKVEPRREAPQNNPAPSVRREPPRQQPPAVRSNPAPEAPKTPPAAAAPRQRPNFGDGANPLDRFRPKNDPATPPVVGTPGAGQGRPAGGLGSGSNGNPVAGNPFDRFRNRGDAAGTPPAVKPPVATTPDAGRPATGNGVRTENPFDRFRNRGDSAGKPPAGTVPGANPATPPVILNPGINPNAGVPNAGSPNAGNPFDRFRNRGDAPSVKPPVATTPDAGRPATGNGNRNENPLDRFRPRGDTAAPTTPPAGGNTGINPNPILNPGQNQSPLDRFRPRGDAAGTPGSVKPGTAQSGTGQSGTAQSGTGQPGTGGGNMIGNNSPFDRRGPRGDSASAPNQIPNGNTGINPNPLDRFRPRGDSAGTPGARPGGNGDGRPGFDPRAGGDRDLADAARRAAEKSGQVSGRPVNPLSFFKRPGDHDHDHDRGPDARPGDRGPSNGPGKPSTRPVVVGGRDHGHDHDHGPNRPGSNTGIVGRPGSNTGIGVGIGPGGITIGVGGSRPGDRRPGGPDHHDHHDHGRHPDDGRYPNYGRNPQYAYAQRPAWSGDGRHSWDSHWHDHGVAHRHHDWHHGAWCRTGRVSYYPSLWTAGWGWGWGWGSLGLSSGYYAYSNPYYVPTQTVVYNYSQPVQVRYIVTEQDGGAPPPQPTSAEEAGYALFDQARGAFRAQDFQTAQTLLDKAALALPGDAVVHEMRALNLFALGRYPESAAVLNSLLSAAPGWDWATMVGLYASPDVYTSQLRALEDFRRANQQDAASRFVLAYHYLVQGHVEAAQSELRRVLLLQPDDRVAAQMLKALSAPAEAAPAEVDPALGGFAAQGQPVGPAGAAAPNAAVAVQAPQAQAPAAVAAPKEAPTASPAPADPAALAGASAPPQGPALGGPALADPALEVQAARPAGGTESAPAAAVDAPTTDLVGKWSGVREGSTFDFSLSDDGKFAWRAQPEKPAPGQNYPELTGAYSLDQNVIVMEDGQGGTMVGTLASAGKDSFVFTMLGAPEDDPGITFQRKN